MKIWSVLFAFSVVFSSAPAWAQQDVGLPTVLLGHMFAPEDVRVIVSADMGGGLIAVRVSPRQGESPFVYYDETRWGGMVNAGAFNVGHLPPRSQFASLFCYLNGARSQTPVRGACDSADLPNVDGGVQWWIPVLTRAATAVDETVVALTGEAPRKTFAELVAAGKAAAASTPQAVAQAAHPSGVTAPPARQGPLIVPTQQQVQPARVFDGTPPPPPLPIPRVPSDRRY